MNFDDHSTATNTAFRDRMDRFESGVLDAEVSLRHRVAVAINAEGAWCGVCGYEDGFECPECQRTCFEYADAAIATLTRPVR